MAVTRLRLWNIRKHSDTQIEPDDRISVFLGANGAGKTTVLEAVSVATTLASPRAGSLSSLVTHDQTSGGVAIDTTEVQLQVRIESGRSKVSVNSKPTTARNYLGRVSSVSFAPEDLDVVTGDPSQRRRMLDDLIIQTRPGFAKTRSDYDRSLRQRNAALRHGDAEAAALYEEALASNGAQIIVARQHLSDELAVSTPKLYSELANTGQLELRYEPRVETGPVPEPELVEHLHELMRRDRHLEIQRKSTRWGPHRDELELALDSHQLRTFGSRGEQRTAALAMKLAGLQILPDALLLLDDVLSELDPDRRDRVMQAAAGRQTMLTATDRAGLPDVAASVFRVEGGVIVAA